MFFNSFIVFPSVSIYMTMRAFSENRFRSKSQQIICTLGGAVFGVYLIEKFLRAATEWVCAYLFGIIGSFAASIFWVLFALLVGLCLIAVLKKLPIVSKIANRFL